MDYESRVHVQSNSPSVESIDIPMSTPQSSTTFSPKMLASLPCLRPNIPVPSIEPPDFGLFELPDISNPRMPFSFNDYENVLDTLKEVNLNPPNNRFRRFQFGQEKELSPFTFRNLHNATPEPTALVEQGAVSNLSSSSGSGSGSGSGLGSEQSMFVSSPGDKQPSTVHASANVVTPRAIRLRASSAPVQLLASNQPPKPARYDTKDEISPDEPYFNKDFQRALQAGKSVAQKIGSVLATCELARDSESQVFSMVQTANELSQFDAPSVCKIGIVGDSGVGTSRQKLSILLINHRCRKEQSYQLPPR
jgi:hypothetical protein